MKSEVCVTRERLESHTLLLQQVEREVDMKYVLCMRDKCFFVCVWINRKEIFLV